MPVGQIVIIPCGVGEFKDLEISPAKAFDVGAGKGRSINAKLEGGTVGIIVDTRGRPFTVDLNSAGRISKLRSYLAAFGLPLPK